MHMFVCLCEFMCIMCIQVLMEPEGIRLIPLELE